MICGIYGYRKETANIKIVTIAKLLGLDIASKKKEEQSGTSEQETKITEPDTPEQEEKKENNEPLNHMGCWYRYIEE